MDERRTEGGGLGGSGFDSDRDRSSAGSANTPMFDRQSSATGQNAHSHGRPPSHREIQEGTLGGERSGERMEGIAMPETQRALEETRDTLAREAAPVVAEKMQEAIEETTDRLSGTIGEQARKTAEAVRHDAENMIGAKAEQLRDRVEQGVDRSMDRAADRIESAAQTLHGTADRHLAGGGVRGTAGRVAHQVADAGEGAAEYLRETDMNDLTRQLERQVRANPLQTLALAAAAGWLVGKILR